MLSVDNERDRRLKVNHEKLATVPERSELRIQCRGTSVVLRNRWPHALIGLLNSRSASEIEFRFGVEHLEWRAASAYLKVPGTIFMPAEQVLSGSPALLVSTKRFAAGVGSFREVQ